ncbi:hypothetical protein B7494_g7982 [Chlorociboria aeruginascens]|nr:hypothetical protein B7494_g7982 [Chlorociboria aeruginascens]
MHFLKALIVSLLPLVALGAKKPAVDKFQQFHSKALSSTPLKLDDTIYDRLTATPRDYSVIVLLTALEARFGCKLCHEFQPEWDLLSKSWTRGDKEGESRLIYGTLDFVDGKNTFQSLGLQTAPVLLLFQPTLGPHAVSDSNPLRFDFTVGSQSAEQVHSWISRYLTDRPHPPVYRPINWVRVVVITTALLGTVTFLSVAWPYFQPILQNRNVWAAVSLIAILLFTSGHMFNHIRKVPYVAGDGRGGVIYFAGGFSNQYGLETQIVAAMYGLLSFATISLALKVPRIADPRTQQVAVLAWGGVVFVIIFFFWITRTPNTLKKLSGSRISFMHRSSSRLPLKYGFSWNSVGESRSGKLTNAASLFKDSVFSAFLTFAKKRLMQDICMQVFLGRLVPRIDPRDQEVKLLTFEVLTKSRHQVPDNGHDLEYTGLIIVLEDEGAVELEGLVGGISPFALLQPLSHEGLVQEACIVTLIIFGRSSSLPRDLRTCQTKYPMALAIPPTKSHDASQKQSDDLLSKSAEAATLLIALQFGSRALTFVVNQLLLRYLSPELLGISTQLEVYSISILFFARESLRVAIQRQSDFDEAEFQHGDSEAIPEGYLNSRTAAGKTQALVNLAYVSVFLGLVFALLLAWLYLRTLQTGDATILATPYFREALVLYGLAAFWELLAEPCFVIVQQKSMFKIRAAAESISTVLRCLVTCFSVVWTARKGWDVGVLPFALGQGMYSISLLVVYYLAVRDIASEGGFSMMVKPIYSSVEGSFLQSRLSRPLLTLGTSIFTQSIVKHVLTQGDTILIASLASQRSQGVYALANNYGGLIARLVFQPVEESSRNYFGKLLSTTNESPHKDLVRTASRNLHMLLRSYVLLSVTVLALGPTMAPILLRIVAGPRWTTSGAGHVLSMYCYYIPLLAINGLTEAFVSSVATKSEVNTQSMWMLAFSAGFGGSAFIFLRVLDLGAEGLVWANTINMFLRILWSISFISSYLRRHGAQLQLSVLVPHPLTLGAGVATFAVLTRMKTTFNGSLSDIMKCGISSAIFFILLLASERKYLLDCFHSVRGQNKEL